MMIRRFFLILFGFLFLSCGPRELRPRDYYESTDNVSLEDSRQSVRHKRAVDSRVNSLVICPMCNGTGVFDFMPGDIMAPKVKCSCCNGTGMCTQEEAKNNLKMKQDVDLMFGNSESSSNNGSYNNDSRRNSDGSLRCPIRYGSGKCDMCAGRGERRYENSFTGANEIMDCSFCRGTGRCQNCYGKGSI